MDPARFRRIETLFLAASDLPRTEQPGFLAAECGDDAALREEVEAMLEHERDTVLEGPGEFRGDLQGVLDEAGDARPQVGMPEKIGKYDVLRRIGLGGMGAVYEAEQQHPQRRVALKVVRPDALSREMLSRFRHETELLGRLQHPGIAQIFEAGTFDLGSGEQPFFAMEFVDGRPLLDFAREQGLTTDQRLELIARICDAVHHAHQQGVIHRDLKSDNVLVARNGKPKILDFGVGRVIDADVNAKTSWTAAGQIVGTLAYMSPEQVSGTPGDVDTRSDVYALGVMLYELLAGRLPFDLRNVSLAEAGRIICEVDPPRLADRTGPSRGDVEAIVDKALEKEKERRYASASDLAADIRRYLDDLPISARPATTWYQLRKFARRHRVAVVGAAATVVALAVGVVSTTIQAVRATRNAAVAASNEEAARRMAYRANIAAASAALGVGDALAARRHLDEAPADLRHWEWRHLDARLDPTEAVHRAEPWPEGVAGRDARLAFAADGTPLCASVRGRTLSVADVVTGESVATIGLAATPTAVALSPDGGKIAVVDASLGLRIWDTAAARLTAETRLVLEEPLIALRFSDDGSVLEASSAHEVHVVDCRTGNLLVRDRIVPPMRYLGAALVGRRQSLIVAAGRDVEWGQTTRVMDQVVRVVDWGTGQALAERPVPWCSHVIACSPDGSRIASSTDPQTHITRILDGSTLAELGRVGGHPGTAGCAAFSADGRLLATGSSERIVVHDAVTLEVRNSLFLPGLEPDTLRWSPDGSRLLVADAEVEARLVRWEAPPFLELRGHESFVYVAAWSPDGTLIASAGWDQAVRLWDGRTGQALAKWPFETDCFYFVAFSPDGTTVYANPGKQYVAWDVATGQRVPIPGQAIAFDGLGEGIYSWMPGGSKLVPGSSGGQNLAKSPDGTLFLGNGRVIEMATGVDRTLLRVDASRIRAVAGSFDNRSIATGHVDGSIRIWDAATGEPRALLQGHSLTPSLQEQLAAEVFSIEFSPDGKRLLSGGDGARVVLWDLEAARVVLALQPHDTYVHVVAFSPDGTRILSGSGDATLRIWDTVPLRERNREFRRAKALQAEMRPRVLRLLEELDDPARIAAELRADASLDPDRRRAALRALLALCGQPR